MKVLLAASEVSPIVKLGGLGDVVGSLPKALVDINVNVDVVVPFFPLARTEGLKVYKSMDIEVPFANETHVVSVYRTKLMDSDVDVILLKHGYFSIGGRSAFKDDISETKMFAFFSKAVVELIKSQFNTYDLIHCNDWHTGLIPHMLEDEMGGARPATLLTIHNLSYQGRGDVKLVQESGFVPGAHRTIDWDIEDGDINLLMQGIISCDFMNTVSPAYAKEILTEEYGGVLADILNDRKSRLIGVLNGIDMEAFPRDYDESSWELQKQKYKKKLQNELNLRQDVSRPLYAFISRLDPNQKGLDILLESVPEIVRMGGQFILLGTGDSIWEKKFEELGSDRDISESVSINIRFDVELANSIYAGSDFQVIPSKFEPCGLIQMIAMRYGSLPIAHSIGGLKDTVKEGNTGFLFEDYSSSGLLGAINKSMNIYGKDDYKVMVVNALKADFSWRTSAKKYVELYEKVIQIRKHEMEVSINR